MEQLSFVLANLQQAAGSLCDGLQHVGDSVFQRQPFSNHGAHNSQARRVSFGTPFASITDSILRGSGNQAPKLLGKPTAPSSKKKPDKPEAEERILISEVEVVGVSEALKKVAHEAMAIRPNFAYTLSEVEADLRRVFATGWFSSCAPDAEDTRDGVKLIIKVSANPELRGVVAKGGDMLPVRVIQHAFKQLHGTPLNFVQFGKAVQKLDKWYQDRGVLGQVVDFTFEGGIVELCIGEAVVKDVQLQFVDQKSGTVKEEGATKPEIITRHLTTRPGRVYNLRAAKADIDSIYSTGLFEDVNIVPKEAEESTEISPKVDLTVNLVERKTGGLGAGTGISAQSHGEGTLPGFVGNFTYNQRNLFGLNQRLSALVELGQADSLFRLQWQDPWIRGDDKRTSRTLSLMNNRHSGAAIHGHAESDHTTATDTASSSSSSSAAIVLGRLVSGVEWRRPLTADWTGTAGMHWQRTSCMDEHGRAMMQDCYGCPLTYSGKSRDTMVLTNISAAYSSPVDGSQLGASLEQSLPFHRDWLNFNRLRLRMEQPVQLGPFTLNFRGKAGAIYGDLPPYEAFPLGGTNSVRGYGEGGVGSGRYFVEGSTELRWKLMTPVYGTLFADYASDLDSGESVIGDPAGARGKPGSGYGYGAGVRIDSPLGPLRLEYGWNDQRRGRFHVAMGYE